MDLLESFLAITSVVGVTGIGALIYYDVRQGAELEKQKINTHISRQIEVKEGHSKENVLENIISERNKSENKTYASVRGTGTTNETPKKEEEKNYDLIEGAKFKKGFETLYNAYLLVAPTKTLPLDTGDEGYGYEYQQPIFDVGGEHIVLLTKTFEPIVPGSAYEVKYRELLPNQKFTSKQLYEGFIHNNKDIFEGNMYMNLEFSTKFSDNIKGVIESIERKKYNTNYKNE